MLYGFGYVARFFRVQWHRNTFVHSAKAAMPRTGIAAQHKCGGSIVPALKNVRTTRFLTHCVKVQAFNQLQNMILIRRVAYAYLQPFGLWQPGLFRITQNSEFASHLKILLVSNSPTF
jgi:hypothetical protein